MKKKMTVMVVALAMVLCFAIGGTLAWLQASTQSVTNTFTYGDINITLTETDSDDVDTDANNNSYKMVPGGTIEKDPKVTVAGSSEDCWLFVKIEEAGSIEITENGQGVEYTFDDFLAYAYATGWTVVEGVYDQDDSRSGNESFVIAREVKATDEVKTFSVLKDDKVIVKTSVTKAMMNAIDDEAESANRPTLTFTAYAVQSANLRGNCGNSVTTAAAALLIIKLV